MIVTDAGRDAVDAAAFCARWDCRAGRETCERSPSERTRDVAAYGEVVWSWRPDAGVKSCGVKSAQPGLDKNISAGDGGKRARSPGRARRKPLKPLRAGMPGDSGILVVTRVRSTTTKCTRGRGCNGHPAFPTPSLGGRYSNASGAWRSGIANVCLDVIASQRVARTRAPLARNDGLLWLFRKLNTNAPHSQAVIVRESGRSSIPRC
jgi:hypothetical protein